MITFVGYYHSDVASKMDEVPSSERRRVEAGLPPIAALQKAGLQVHLTLTAESFEGTQGSALIKLSL